jgi:hypothetical protein
MPGATPLLAMAYAAEIQSGTAMVVCPIAIAVGCRKCPAVSICPLKSVIGNHRPELPPAQAPVTKSPRSKTRSKRARTRRPRKR